MDVFVIQGGRRLSGRVRVEGSKNAALPLMAASLLTDDTVRLGNLSSLSDITSMSRLLGELGVSVQLNENEALLRTVDRSAVTARYDIVKTMRASICVLGPMLALRVDAIISMPGGCSFGARPVDLHLRGLRALGAKIELREGNIYAK